MSSKEEFVIGRHPAREVLQSDRDVNKVFLQDGLSSGKISELFDLAKARGIQVSFGWHSNTLFSSVLSTFPDFMGWLHL